MPLLHQDNDRGSGTSQEKSLSLADFLSFDGAQVSEAVAPSTHRNNDGEIDWRWESASSPEAAASPRGLVPPACFPPRHAAAFGTCSEGARPGSWAEPGRWTESVTLAEPGSWVEPVNLAESGSWAEPVNLAEPGGWAEESSSHGITDLVDSLNALAMPPTQPVRARSNKTRRSCEFVDPSWPPEGAYASSREERRVLPRRASFCGVAGGVAGGGAGQPAQWSGRLPPRGMDLSAGFSAKVFLGGLPWDIGEQALLHALRQFQPVRVEWPGRDSSAAPRGFAYVTLEHERCVHALLAESRRDGPDWYYRVASRNMRNKDVQVIPWAVSDSNWVIAGGDGSMRLESERTVFVGALHGMLSASALATIMNDLFSGVVYAGIDTDKNKYPIGSGRVTFNNAHSYVRAIYAGYVEIRTDKFTKKIQVNPYLEESMCSVCNLHQGPYFCRDPACFRYFCRSCWACRHGGEAHTPLVRNSKSTQAAPASARAAPSDHGGFRPANNGERSSDTLTSATPSPPGGAIEAALEAAPDWQH